MFSAIWNWLKNAAKSFWNAVKRLVLSIVNFFKNIVEYFKRLILDPKKHKPFIADMAHLKDMIDKAPVKQCGIFQGVYNEETNEIENYQIIEADQLDATTKETLGNDPLVVLC